MRDITTLRIQFARTGGQLGPGAATFSDVPTTQRCWMATPLQLNTRAPRPDTPPRTQKCRAGRIPARHLLPSAGTCGHLDRSAGHRWVQPCGEDQKSSRYFADEAGMRVTPGVRIQRRLSRSTLNCTS
ncbi:hypothetical protein NUM3379_34300 [Kineococcus sp. NUM-3379]